MMGFIVNPVSGNGKGCMVWDVLERKLKHQGAVYRVRKTSEEGEAQKIAIELIQKEGVNKIIAVGGDGTVNEVINGIHQSGQDCLFGHVAAGSGNDFARGHGLPKDPWQAMDRIMSEEGKKKIDLLKVNGRVAVNSVGAGFDGQVAKMANEAQYKRWLNRIKLGSVAYVLSVIRALWSYQPCEVKITVDGQTRTLENVWLIAVANIPNYGGGMLICPGAVPDDGQAEICIVSNVSRLELLRAFPMIFTGAHIRHPGVSFLRGSQIHIQSQTPLIVHADGEVVSETPANVEIMACNQAICG